MKREKEWSLAALGLDPRAEPGCDILVDSSGRQGDLVVLEVRESPTRATGISLPVDEVRALAAELLRRADLATP